MPVERQRLREIKALPPASGNATSDPYAIKPCSLRRHASHCPALPAAVVAVGMKGDIPGSSAAIARLPKLVITPPRVPAEARRPS